MLNVLSILPYHFLPAKMGGQKCAFLDFQFLAKHVNLTCVTTKNNNPNNNDFEVFNILSNSQIRYINVFYFFKLRKIIKQKQVTHLIIEHPYYGWLALLLKWFCGVKLIIRSQNIEALRFKSVNKWWWKILWHYEKIVHQNADINLFITDIDMDYAITNYPLSKDKCVLMTYGFELKNPPSNEAKNESKIEIKNKYKITNNENIIVFNGTLSYKPNMDAVDAILNNINPALIANNNFKYKIIICGKSLPESYNNLVDYKSKNIIYAGFVDDINTFYKAADIFINPVMDGGGIKTKIVEALGFNVSLVTTQSGAIGIPPSITGSKMKLINNNDWASFAKAIVEIDTKTDIPSTYFDHFYYGNIAQKVFNAIQKI